jgi:hypothetical protein
MQNLITITLSYNDVINGSDVTIVPFKELKTFSNRFI